MTTFLTRAGRHFCALLVILFALASCGGGGSGVGDLAGVGTGGTGPAAVGIGPISGFGSVIVGGVRYDDSRAVVTDDEGAPRSRLDLRLGMVAEISGSADFTARTGVATAIRYGSEVLGPVTSVNTAANRFSVLGVGVDVVADTVFDERLTGVAALGMGDPVEVYGYYNVATGRFTATRVDSATGASRYTLRGTVSGLDTTRKRFALAGLTIDYAAVPAAQTAALANGQALRVSATRAPAGGVWVIDALTGAARASLAEGEAEIVGRIDSLTSARHFSVEGVSVDATAASVSGTPALGLRVQVEGTVKNGVLQAREVEVSDDGQSETEEFDLTDVIQSFDPATQRFRLRGQLVDASGTVSFEDGSRSDLANGVRIECKGSFDAALGAVRARLIHFER
ncbi:MAG TPA: DUF5666 domain-containing protein [Zoogloea sp.]|uniref:DUF5666 domain-containing protein n=1 Tax=Zoogloea sp. TaxID=49181 RepID=UPI002B99A199|nr:DUF5666 domain-containing protein [Zoogloea sp.]HMV17349.1 DUF5666 domain-containing protein [Rhodocyclaceae bacterium]HMV63299.1 DUF5666 domain-containing protein [Rhodocyclaceae bacterium]HMW51857.1 DUF5666 domain-containing protein [Rhodocyclaceae bacterium]HMY49432.1 DUF5666 domain-containing protein [Rhodocyclaceae bacterium]HMZ77002.1 DUF5666 domain-containing protein [Rhodocyclaceae bacterium]